MADVKWRRRGGGWWPGVLLFAVLMQANGYEEMYTISQLSPKSVLPESPQDFHLEYSDDLSFNIEPSALFSDDFAEIQDRDTENIAQAEEREDHIIVARSADPMGERESRSINVDELPLSNNNEIDNELDIHNRRKYYEILPTRTIDDYRDRDEILFSSHGFGDRIDFKLQGEGQRVPKGRALPLQGPKVRPTAVQPLFATASPKDQGRQNNAEIQNIITGIVKLLNGNVNVQANSQLLRPGRPMNSRINNRGPPRISDAPNLPPDFEKPVTQYVPTKTPPPYPFDRPPHHGMQIPEQIVPPVSTAPYRPGFHRPNLPPWHRPRPRPIPSRRPNPGLPNYKPNMPMPVDIPTIDLSEEKLEDEDVLTLHDSEITQPDNDVHKEEDKLQEVTTQAEEATDKDTTETTTHNNEANMTVSSTTSTTEAAKTTTTEKETEAPTEKPTTTTSTSTTTEKVQEKPQKPEKEKKKDSTTEKSKEKYKITEEKQQNKTSNETATMPEVLEPSMSEKPTTLSFAAPTPTEGLLTHSPTVNVIETSSSIIKTASINSQPLPPSRGISNQPNPYRPRPGIVLDDTDFKPQGSRHRGEAAVITAAETRLPGGYGEIFDVTVSAVQGPGEKGGASVHIQNVNPHLGHGEPDDIIVSAVGDQGYVSIDGKRTYLNLFGDSSTQHSISPTQVLRPPAHSAPPTPQTPSVGTGVAIPADDTPQVPVRRPAQPVSRPQQPFRRPQPTVRIDTCIVGDDSTCDQAQNEKCRTEAGISSCQCRPGYARRSHRDPCRRVVSLQLSVRVDRLYDRKVAWDAKLADKESEPYQHLSFEALRAIDSAFSMTPFSDDFVGGAVNSVHRGESTNQGVFVNYTILLQESPESLRTAVATDIQRHLLGVIRRRSNNVGASALWVDSPAGAVLAPNDVDECAIPDLNDCHKLATCTNTWGGFRCTCPDSTRDTHSGELYRGGRDCQGCATSYCNDRGSCHYANNQPYCSCMSGYYGSTCEVDGEVVGVAVGASLAAALVIALTLAALLSWSRKWSREQKAAGMGSPVFSYMANTIKAPPVGQPPYQVTLEERMRWAQIAEAMAANHYAQAENAQAQAMATRPSSAMFGGYPTLPPVPLPRSGLYMGTGHHTGTMNTVASRANTAASHHALYGYTNHAASESTSSEASSRVQERADLLVPRPKSRARSMHNQTGIYYDVEYENAPEAIYGSKGIPLSTYTVSRGPPFYRT